MAEPGRARSSIPPPPPWLVRRPALAARLEEGLRSGANLVIVSAPAGYGKTRVLADWARSRAPRVAWLSLDSGDDDPARLASGIEAAIAAAGTPGAGRGSPEGEPVARIVDLLAAASPFLLAMDDAHLLRSAASVALVQSLAERLPEGAVLALAARSEPRLRLARLRAAGRLLELREPELRFRAAEAAELAAAAGAPGLSPDEAALLEARTEGWAAGIVLAARSLAARTGSGGRGAAAALLRDARAAHRWALDFLLEEVLDAASPDLSAFLLSTCVLVRISRPLAEAVARSPVPLGSLEALAREALFLSPLDDEGEWWRYHPLFADLLLGRLREAGPDRERELRSRAAAWLEERGLDEEAAAQRVASGDAAGAARLLESAAEGLVARGELAYLLARIEELPRDAVAARPALLSAKAFCLFYKGGSIREIEEALAPVGGELGSLFGSLADLYRGKSAKAAIEADRLLADPSGDLGALGRFVAGMVAAFVRSEAGRHDEALALAETAAKEGGLLARCSVAAFAGNEMIRRGELSRAESFMGSRLESIVPPGAAPPSVAGRILVLLGEISLIRGDFELAESRLVRGMALLERMGEACALGALLGLARLRSATGEDASRILEKARRIAGDFDLTDLDDRSVAMAAAHDDILRGDVEAARRWAESLPPPPGEESVAAFYERHTGKYEKIEKARLLLAERRPEAALSVLAPLEELFAAYRRELYLPEILLLRALAEESRRRHAEAETALASSLARAAPEGIRLPFIEGGAPALALLGRIADRLPEPSLSFARSLAFPGEGAASPAPRAGDPAPASCLRPREAEILSYLPSALSVSEIGERLYLSENTVKTHLKSLYAKLGAHSRSDAIAKAEAKGLISLRGALPRAPAPAQAPAPAPAPAKGSGVSG